MCDLLCFFFYFEKLCHIFKERNVVVIWPSFLYKDIFESAVNLHVPCQLIQKFNNIRDFTEFRKDISKTFGIDENLNDLFDTFPVDILQPETKSNSEEIQQWDKMGRLLAKEDAYAKYQTNE